MCIRDRAQSVNGPLAILNEYYDVYVTQPDDAKWRLDNMHEVYLKDMNSKYVYPNGIIWNNITVLFLEITF